MKPNHFEKEWKERLQDRSIQPSEGSWERLRGRLDAGSRKRKTVFARLAMAASFVAGLLLANLLFTKTTAPDIVDVPEVLQTENHSIAVDPIESQLSPVEENPAVPTKIDPIPEVDDHRLSNNESNHSNTNKITDTGFGKIAEENTTVVPEETLVDPQVVEETIVSLIKTQELPEDPSEAEVDALLAQAADRIARERRSLNTTSSTAQTLLQDVEDELTQTFRDKVFEAFKTGFLKTKDAVVMRSE